MSIEPIDLERESWRPVEGCSSYEVSDLGNVRSLDRLKVKRDGTRQFWPGKRLTPVPDSSGHLNVTITKDDSARLRRGVHRLVIEAFIGPCPDGMECCHNNGDPADNRLLNLRWGTRSDNNLDRVRHGTHHESSKTHCVRGHPFVLDSYIDESGRRICRSCLAFRNSLRRVPGGRKVKLTAEVVRQIERLAAQGLSQRAIAGQVGISQASVHNAINGKVHHVA